MPQEQNTAAPSTDTNAGTNPSPGTPPVAPPLVVQPASAPQNQPQQPQPAPALSPQAAANAHHSRLGQAVERLMTGEYTDYQVGPDGKVQPITIKEKPGQFFRRLAASALLGMAAGAPHRDEKGNLISSDFGAGFGRGASAAIGARQQQDEQRYTRARQAASDQRENEDAKQRRLYEQAQIWQMHIQNLHADAQMNLFQQEHLDKLNEQAASYITAAQNAGAKQSPIFVGGKDINGLADNGRLYVQAVNKDPSILKDTPEYHRFHVQTVDYSGLEWSAAADGKGKWVDSETGKEVDLKTRTTHTVYDIPQSFWSERRALTGKELNTIAGYGIADPAKFYNMSMQELTGLRTEATKNLVEITRIQYDIARSRESAIRAGLEAERLRANVATAGKAEMQAAYEAYTTKSRADNDVLTNLSKDPDPDPETKVEIEQKRKEIAEDGQYLADLQARLFPRSAAPNPTAPNAPAPTGAPVPTPGSQDAGFAAGRAALNRRPSLQVGQQVTLKNGQTVTVKQINPNGTFEY